MTDHSDGIKKRQLDRLRLFVLYPPDPVRIEDNIVMKNGRAEVLSAEIMKDPDEIEAFFAKR